MNNNIWAIAFLMAGTLLTAAVTTMVPAAYADHNENEAEDDVISQQNDCDEDNVSGNSPSFESLCRNEATIG